MNKRVLIVLSVVLGLAVVVTSAISFTAWRSSNDNEAALSPIIDVATTFPVPPGATTAFPDHTDPVNQQVVRGWNAVGTLDSACATWRESYRLWVGGLEQTRVEGEVSPNVSCTFRAPKGAYDTTLVVAKYSEAPPVVTLQVTGRPQE